MDIEQKIKESPNFGRPGDDTPIWVSEIIHGDEKKQILIENTNYTQ